jgi:DinB superfamily
MIPINSSQIFEQAFDTFKAFDDLTVASSSFEQQTFPASIWQILQHLLMWQEHQVAHLQGLTLAKSFNEKRSWDSECVPSSEAALQAAVTQFKQQLVELQAHANQLSGESQDDLDRGLVLQSVALHLSFHLGEVILMRRLQGTYPLPAQMREFLQG